MNTKITKLIFKILFLSLLGLPKISHAQFTELTPNINGESASNFLLATDTPNDFVDITSDGQSIAIGGHGNPGAGRGTVRVYTRNGNAWDKQGADIDGDANDDQLGFSVAIAKDASGALIVATGAPYNDLAAENAGIVKIYKLVNSTWSLITTIKGYKRSYGGYALDLSDDASILAVTYPNADQLNNAGSIENTNTGLVRVFKLNASSASQIGADIYGTVGESMGQAVSLSGSGDRIVIGAALGYGIARVYRYSGSAWILENDLKNSNIGNHFGQSVAISSDGTRIAVGALNVQPPIAGEGESGPCRGLVRTFQRSGTNWSQIGSDIIGVERPDCAYVVSLNNDGKRLAIGGPGVYFSKTNKGAVKIYDWLGNDWTETGAGQLKGINVGDFFGQSLCLSSSGARIVIGAPFYSSGFNGVRCGNSQIWQLANPPAVKSVIFAIDDNVAGSKGEKVSVPVKVTNFTNIRSFTMTVQVDDKSVASITGLSSTLKGFDKFESEAGKTWTVRYNSSDPVTLTDGSTAFTIEVLLNGNQDQSTKLNIIGNPLSIAALKIENNVTSSVTVEVKSGSVLIKKSSIDLSGKVITRKNEGIQNAIVNVIGTLSLANVTDQNGNYSFSGLSPDKYTIKVEKSTNVKNGVDIFDLTALEDHIITRKPITDSYRYLAADVNNDGVIDILDISDVEDIIIKRKDNYKDNLSWRFIPTNESLTLEKVKNKSYATTRVTNNTGNQAGLDFYGIKTGDIDDSADPKNITSGAEDNIVHLESRSAGSLSIKIPEVKARKNESIYLPVILENFKDVRAFQFQVKWNINALSFVAVTDAIKQLDGFGQSSYQYNPAEPGVLNVLWKSTNNQSLAGNAVLLKLNLKVLANLGESPILAFEEVKALSLEGAINDAKVTSGKVTVSDVSTRIDFSEVARTNISIYPNPAQNRVRITGSNVFELIGITDMNGRQFLLNEKGRDGYEMDLSRFASGVYFLQIVKQGRLYSEKIFVNK